MTQPEKRRNERVHTALPVFLEGTSGVTRDLSASDAFFWTRGSYAPGDSINFTIGLNTVGGGLMRRCQGVVVRTEHLAHMVGVAANITGSTLEYV